MLLEIFWNLINERSLMKKLMLLICLLTFSTISIYAQHQKMYFFKNNGQSVKKKDSADYYRTIQKPGADNDLYIVSDYFIDGTKKSIGYSSTASPISYQGDYISYYKSGNKKMWSHYTHGMQDTVKLYYPNGILHKHAFYTTTVIPLSRNQHILTVKDSTGKDLVTDGNGTCSFYDDDFNEVIESGSVKNGVYDGLWTGKSGKNIKFKEIYKDGKLVSGESTKDDGDVVVYKELFKEPSFTGGIDKFYEFVSRSVRYPVNAAMKGIQGIAIIQFVVLPNGNLTGMQTLNDVDTELADEAKKVIKNSPKWEPGLYRGRPARTYFKVPISFALNGPLPEASIGRR